MEFMSYAKNAARKIINQAGFDLVRIKKNPQKTLLGLKNQRIQTVVDVGANTGQFAQKILEFFPNAHLFCFEPLPEPYSILNGWVNTQAGRVEVFNQAVGDSEGRMEMNFHTDHSPSSSLLKSTGVTESYFPFTAKQEPVSIEITTLDAALGRRLAEMPKDILVKIDVQGYEDRVIRGGRMVLSTAKACILEVSLDSLYEQQAEFKDLLSMLGQLGFRYAGNLQQVYEEDGHVIYLDAVFIK
jgi:FkbM family methyltransferase